MKKAFAAFCVLAFVAQQCDASSCVVNTASGTGTGSLSWAITQANGNACLVAGVNSITFDLTSGDTINLSASLPVITSNMTINGTNSNDDNPVTINGEGQYQIFTIGNSITTVNATIENMTVQNGLAEGGTGGSDISGFASGAAGGGGLGAGGGLLVNNNAQVTVVNVDLTDDKAQGGAGGAGITPSGSYTPGVAAGGGGGLNGGSGGSSNGAGPGGGGGWGTGASGGAGASTGADGSAGVATDCSGPGTNCGSGGAGNATTGGANGGGGGGSDNGYPAAGGGGLSGSPATIIGNAEGGAGGFGGGGGGGNVAGNGGFGGGGGGDTSFSNGSGGTGGFGGGGGGGGTSNAAGGVGGGSGNAATGNGGGGAGLGGAVFVSQGGSINIEGTTTIDGTNTATGGAAGGSGATAGSGAGGGIFLMNGVAANFNVGSGQTSTVASSIAGEGAIGGSGTDGGVSLAGGGTLNLSAGNSYNGGTTVSGGSTLGIAADDNLGAASGGVTLNGGTLQLQSSDITSARSFTLQSGGGAIDTDGNVAETISGDIGGGGALTIESSVAGGQLTLSGNNTYTGGTTLAGGQLSISGVDNIGGAGAGPLTFSGGNLQTTGALNFSNSVTMSESGTIDTYGSADAISGQVSGIGGLTVTDTSGSGTGALTLSNAANDYSGGTTITGSATLGVTADGALGTGGLTFDNGTLQTLSGLGTDSRSVDFAGNGTINTENNTSTLNGLLSGTGNLTVTGGGNLALGDSSNANAGNFSGNVTVAGNSTLSVSNDGALGSGGILALDAGTLATTGDITDARTITLTGADNTIATGGNTSAFNGLVQDGASAGALTISGGGTVTLGDASNSYSGGTTVTGNSTLAVSNDGDLGTGGLALNSGTLSTTSGITDSRDITLTGVANAIATSGNSSTFDGLIADGSSAGGLTITGGGTVTLGDGSNSYSGGTTVTGNSTLAVANDGALGMGSLALDNGTLSTTAGLTDTRSVNVSGNDTIATGGFSSSFGGQVSGSGNVTINGGGSVLLSADNSGFSGNTDVTGDSALAVSNNGALGSGQLTLDGATLQTQAAVTLGNNVALTVNNGTVDTDGKSSTINGQFTGASGALTVTDTSGSGAGVLTLTDAANSYAGGTTITGGATLGVTADGAMGSGGLTFNNGTLQTQASLGTDTRSVDFAGAGTINTDLQSSTLDGLLSGTGSLAVTGGGTLALGDNSNSGSFSGNVSVSGNSTLSVANDGALGSGAILALNSGILATTQGITDSREITLAGASNAIATGGNDSTFNGQITGVGGALAVNGGGTVTLGDAANSYSGGTTVTGDSTLAVSADGAMGSGILTLNNGTLETLSGLGTDTRDINLTGNGTINTDGANASTFNGLIANGASAGGLTISGGGTVTLGDGSNSYSGGTTVTGDSTLAVGNDGALGTGGLALNNGTLSTTAGIVDARAVNVSGNDTIATGGFDSSFAGQVSGSGNVTVNGGGSVLLSEDNSGFSGNTDVTGNSTLAVSNSGALGSGQVALDGSTLQTQAAVALGNNVALTANNGTVDTDGQASTISGQITGASGALTVTDTSGSGTGVLTLTDAANSYAGGTTITGGATLGVTADGALGTGGLTFNNGTLQTQASLGTDDRAVDFAGNGAVNTDGQSSTLGGLLSGSGNLAVTGGGTLALSDNNSSSYSGDISVSGNSTLSVSNDDQLGSGSLALNSGSLATTSGIADARSISLTGANNSIATGGNNSAFNGLIADGTSAGGVTINGGGSVTLGDASNSYSGGTTVTGDSTLAIANDGALGAGSLTLNSGTLSTTAGLTDSRDIALSGAANTIATNGNTLAFNGLIANGASAGGLAINGGGTVTLGDASNSYSGGTTVTGNSILAVGNDGALGTGGLALNNGTLSTTAGLTDTRSVNLSGNDTIATGGFDSSFAGQVSGAGNVTVSGGGSVLLSADNSGFSGNTDVTGDSTLAVSNSGALGSGQLTLDGSTLQTQAAVTLVNNVALTANDGTVDTDGQASTISGQITGASGALTVTDASGSGTGVLTLTDAANSYAGGTAITGGATLGVTADGALGTGGLTFNNGTLETQASLGSDERAVDFAGNGAVNTDGQSSTLGGLLSGSGNLAVTGGGTLALSDNNSSSYSGDISVSGNSTLSVSNDDQLGSGSLALNSGSLATTSGIADARSISLTGANNSIATGGNNSAFNGLIADGTSAGGVTINGGGSVTLGDASNSYSGGTTVTGDSTLAVSADSAMGSGMLTLNNGTLETLSGLGTDTRDINLTGNGAIDTDGANTSTFDGLIANGASAGGLTINGGGTVTLGDASNSYSGGTTVTGDSILKVGNDGALGSGALALDNGTLSTTAGIADMRAVNVSGNDVLATEGFDSSFAGQVSGAGNLTVSGGGSVLLSGSNSGFSGNADITGNSTLALDNSDALGSGALTLDGATLQTQTAVSLANGVTLTSNNGTVDADGQSSSISGQITGAGSLTVTDSSDGGGKLTLTNAANNYSGGTTIAGSATLGVAADGALGSGGLTFNDGTLQTQTGLTDARAIVFTGAGTIDTDDQASSFSGALSGAGSLSVTGGGTVALSHDNSSSYSGDISVSGNSTLSVSNDDQLGSGSLALNSGSLATTAGITDARTISLTGLGNTIATGGNTSAFNGQIVDGGSGGGLTIAGGGSVALGDASNSYSGGTTVNANTTVAISADGDLGSDAGQLTLAGGTLQTTAGLNLTRGVALSGGGTIDADGHSSTLSDAIDGSGGLVVTDSLGAGNGKISLNASNDYSGGTLVENNAVLGIVNDDNLGQTGAGNGLTLDQGTLQLQSNVDSGRAISLNGTGGTVDLDGKTSSLTGSIGGTGALTLVDTSGGSGMLTLSGNNSYSGGTVIDAGTLSAANDSALGAETGGVTLNGGTLFMTGSGFATSRAFTLGASGGTLETDASNTASVLGGIDGPGALDVTGGGTLVLSGANGYTGGTAIGTNTTLAVANSSALGSGGVTVGNSATLQTQSNVTLANAVTLGPGGGSGGGTIDTDGFDSAITGQISGGALTKLNGGILTLGNFNNDYQGGTNLDGGVIAITSDGDLGNASGGLTFNGGTLQTQASLTSGRSITLDSAGGTIDTDGNDSTLSGTIGGSGGLTKIGAGTLSLGNPNDYTGGTTISGGTLRILDDSALGSTTGGVTFNGGTLQMAAAVTTNRTLTLNSAGGAIDTFGNASTIGGLVTGSGALSVSDSSGGNGSLTLTDASNNYSGGTQVNSGTLIISNAGALGSGGLTLNGGTLETTADTTYTGNVTITSAGGTIDTDPNITLLTGQLSGYGTLFVSGGGTLKLTDANQYSGGTVVAANTTLGVNSDLNLGSGGLTLEGGTLQTSGAVNWRPSVTLSGGGTIDTDDNDSTFSGVVGGNGGLAVTDVTTNGGQLSLTNLSNSYAGGTTVTGNAVLGIAGDTSLGQAGYGVTLNGGTLRALNSLSSARTVTLGTNGGILDADGNTETLTGQITGSGSLIVEDSADKGGVVIVAGSDNNYTGATTINSGTLELGANQALPATTAVNLGCSSANNCGTFNVGIYNQTVALFQGDGTLAVSPQSATTPSLTVTGNATISGTTLSVLPANPQYVQNNQTFDILHTTLGQINGSQFASVLSPIIELAFTPTITNTDVTVKATLIPLASFAATPNQAAVASGLEAVRALSSPTDLAAAAVVSDLYAMNKSQLQAAFDQMGPISLAGMSGMTFAAAGVNNAAIAQRMAGLRMADPDADPAESFAYYKVSSQSSGSGSVMAYGGDTESGIPFSSPEGRWSVFASGVDTLGRLDSTSGSGGVTPGYNFNAGGATFGADYRFNENFVAGLSGGYLSGNATVDDALGNVTNQSLRYGAYGTAYNGAFHANLYAGGAQDTFATTRNTVGGTASGNAGGGELNTDVSVGYDVPVAPVTVSPFADLAYDQLTIDPFTETGAGDSDLSLAKQTAQSMLASLGGKVTWKYIKSETTSLLPYLSLGLDHEFDNQSRALSADFAGTGSWFSVQTADVARSGVLAGAGLTVSWGSGFSTKLDYAGDFRSNFNAQSIQGSLRYQF